ncbi:MAG: hypothetical protein NVS3B10_15430 [Polyangiales bacterium]
MNEIHRTEHMTVRFDAGRMTLAWTREEPDDAHAVETARGVKTALDGWLAEHPTEKIAVLVDLVVVKRNFPRAVAAYTAWLLGHRARITVGAFATKSFLLRAGLTAAVLVPGLTMKGFGDVRDAETFLATHS